ncbi:MAG TPA: M20/M25/M40 family metallo-hydrolase, partial [Chloroflexota bacterium]|nr:M20/M25/M40 family metallo-hydrolase [Chloroflexota bacterium]
MPSIPSALDLLSELISINSANASMGTDNPGEAEYARYVADYGERFGAHVSLTEALPGRPNVLLRLPATAARASTPLPRLLFDIHLDTVPLEPMPNATTPRIADGRLWGRGACDTKSSMASVLVALHRLAESGAPRAGEILILGSVDEEYQKRGIAHAVASGMCHGVTAAVVGEPTALQPVIAHKGAVRWRIRTAGKAAHT